MSTTLAALGNRTPEQLKVAELREELRKRGIQIKGLKKDLVDRLEDVLRQEELEHQKALAGVLDAGAGAAPAPIYQPDPVTPFTKRRSKGHAKQGAKDVIVSEPENMVVASAGMEVAGAMPALRGGDVVSQSVAESLPGGSEAAALIAAGGADETGATPLEGGPLSATTVFSLLAREDISVEAAETATAPPALEDLVADLERLEDSNFNKSLQEEPQVQQAGEQGTGVIRGEILSEKPTDILPMVEKGVDEVMGGTEVITTTVENTVTTTVEAQVFSVVSEDQNIVTVQEDQFVTTTTRFATMEESANEVVSTEDTITTVVTVEKTITGVVDGEGVKLDMEAVRLLEDKSDHVGEASKEYITKVANENLVAEIPEVEALMDVDAGTGKETSLETPEDELPMLADVGNKRELNVKNLIEETPMDVDAGTQKGSKRKDGVDGELITLEPMKRRRWNSAKSEGDSRGLGKGVQSLELQEPVPSSVAIAPPSAKGQTPKSAPPEKVAVTRTAPTGTESTVNGESQKTRVVPPSAKPATTSLKIDKFLRPFTFKAVKELLAQTGTVQDVWMDQIKTHCYVTYPSIEEATATRNALFNLQWPPQGGRFLTAEFVDPSEVKFRSDGENATADAGHTATAAPPKNAITPRGANSASLKALKYGSVVPSSGQPSTPAAATLPPPPPLPFPLRERSKQEVEKTPTLDDLFRKTGSKPHIYYLELTAEEVADKVAVRSREAAAKPR